MSIKDLWAGNTSDDVRAVVELTNVLDEDSVQVCVSCGHQFPSGAGHCPKCGTCGGCG